VEILSNELFVHEMHYEDKDKSFNNENAKEDFDERNITVLLIFYICRR
jgi:hypothetical protein